MDKKQDCLGAQTRIRTSLIYHARRMGIVAAALVSLGATESDWSVNSAVAAPPLTYPRLLPLQVGAPSQELVGQARAFKARRTGSVITVRLTNPGAEAPDSRLRVIIHDKDHRHGPDSHDLSPNNVKVEVQEGGSWKSVLLEMVDGGVLGAIGTEGVATHRERHKRGGFPIPAGFDKTWLIRVTFDMPGTYSVVVAVSPDNGSRHIAQPVHHIIEVQ